jgi:ribosomal protein L35
MKKIKTATKPAAQRFKLGCFEGFELKKKGRDHEAS